MNDKICYYCGRLFEVTPISILWMHHTKTHGTDIKPFCDTCVKSIAVHHLYTTFGESPFLHKAVGHDINNLTSR